jgi:hypothetical protein
MRIFSWYHHMNSLLHINFRVQVSCLHFRILMYGLNEELITAFLMSQHGNSLWYKCTDKHMHGGMRITHFVL